MFVDRKLDWTHTQAVIRLEEVKKWFASTKSPRLRDYDDLLQAEKAAEASGRAVVVRAIAVGAGRSQAVIARLQEEHGRQYYSLGSSA